MASINDQICCSDPQIYFNNSLSCYTAKWCYTQWVTIKDGPQSRGLSHIRESKGLGENASPENFFTSSMDEMKMRSGKVAQEVL